MSVINIDLPDSISDKLHKISKNKFEIENFVIVAVAEKLEYLQERAKLADIEDFEKILAKVPDIEPEEYDKINETMDNQKTRPR